MPATRFNYSQFTAAVRATSLVLLGLTAAGLLILRINPAAAAPGRISHFVGGNLGRGQATNVAQQPFALTLVGNHLLIADYDAQVIRALNLDTGAEEIFAGTARLDRYSCCAEGSGDSALLGFSHNPSLLADSSGNAYYSNGIAVVRIDPAGTSTNLAGGGDGLTEGLGGPATSARISHPGGLAIDGSGSLFFATAGGLWRVAPDGTINHLSLHPGDPGATKIPGYGGDGGPVGKASFAYAKGTLFRNGELVVADTGNSRIRVVDSSGNVRTIAGTGEPGYSGDGGPATAAALSPQHLAGDAQGNLYFTQRGAVRRITPTGIISTIAGTGEPGYSGDGGPAAAAHLGADLDLAVHPDGRIFVADFHSRRVREIGVNGVIRTIAGNGTAGWSGDGAPAVDARVFEPTGGGFDPAGNYYFADSQNGYIRRVGTDGRITSVAGQGSTSNLIPRDGEPGLSQSVGTVADLKVDAQGNVYFAAGSLVRRLSPDGKIVTVAGGAEVGFSGDGGPATSAALHGVKGIALDRDGNLYIADSGNNRVRKVDASGKISTVAGRSKYSPANPPATGDGVPATDAYFDNPEWVAVNSSGELYIADTGPMVVRKVGLDGRVGTVAGRQRTSVDQPLGGNGIPATEAYLDYPLTVAVAPDDSLYIGSRTVARVDPWGALTGGGITSPIPVRGAPGLSFDSAGNLYASAPHEGLGGPELDPVNNSTPAKHAVVKVENPAGLFSGVRPMSSWGWNALGQLGDATVSDRLKPAKVATSESGAVRGVSAGLLHSLSITSDGRVQSWGWNALGQLGDGTTSDRKAPVTVLGLSGVRQISAGAYHNLAVKDDGTVWSWGWNIFGQLGDGTNLDRYIPVKVQGLSDVVEVSAGLLQSYALNKDGTVWAWGWNGLGQLGNGTRNDSVVAVKVQIGNVASISAGGLHALGVLRTGTVVAWGWNPLGQLGDGTTTDRLTPVALPGLSDIRLVSGGFYHNLATTNGGEVKGWGWNGLGQLGDGTTVDRHLPVNVALPPGFRATDVAAGILHSLAADHGQVAAWGFNILGQLGDGTTVDRLTPARISSLNSDQALDVSVGAHHSLVGRTGLPS